jgi:hypothetical protein
MLTALAPPQQQPADPDSAAPLPPSVVLAVGPGGGPWWHVPQAQGAPSHSQPDIRAEVERFFVFCNVLQVHFWVPPSSPVGTKGTRGTMGDDGGPEPDHGRQGQDRPPYSYPVLTLASQEAQAIALSLSHSRMFGGEVVVLVLPWGPETRASLSAVPPSPVAGRRPPSPVAVWLAKGLLGLQALDQRLDITPKARHLAATLDRQAGLTQKAALLSWWFQLPQKLEQGTTYLQAQAEPLLAHPLGARVQETWHQAKGVVQELAADTHALLLEQHRQQPA